MPQLDVDTGESGPAMHPQWFFRSFEAWDWWEQELLPLVERGPVLDLGAGAGRASLYLQAARDRRHRCRLVSRRGGGLPAAGRPRRPARRPARDSRRPRMGRSALALRQPRTRWLLGRQPPPADRPRRAELHRTRSWSATRWSRAEPPTCAFVSATATWSRRGGRNATCRRPRSRRSSKEPAGESNAISPTATTTRSFSDARDCEPASTDGK